MNNTRFKQLWGLALALLLIPSIATAQAGDTVDYRYQVSILPDGTEIGYEIGGIGLIQGGTSNPHRYIAMKSTHTDGTHLRTDTFSLAGNYDSLRFVRFATAQDQNMVRTFEYDEDIAEDSAGLFNFLMDWEATADLDAAPTEQAFDTNSSILYILELRRSFDDVLLARLDTVKVYLKAGVGIRWRHYKGGGSISHVNVSSYGPNVVYLNVARVQTLPSGVSLTHEFYSMNNQTNGMGSYANGAWVGPMDWYPAPPVAPMNVSGDAKLLRNIAIYPNPSPSRASISFDAKVSGIGRLFLMNSIGQVEYSTRINISSGSNRLELDFSEVPSGAYQLVIQGREGLSFHETATLTLAK